MDHLDSMYVGASQLQFYKMLNPSLSLFCSVIRTECVNELFAEFCLDIDYIITILTEKYSLLMTTSESIEMVTQINH